MFKLKFSYLFIALALSILFSNCRTEKKAEIETEIYKSELNLKKDLADFISKMSEKDTVRIIVNSTMEYWVRFDELELTKMENKIWLSTTIKEDTTYELKNQMRINELADITIENEGNKFEQHFVKKTERQKGGDAYQWIYKIISPNDTLKFYTNGLGDKGGEVKDYLDFMQNYYPNEMEFRPVNVY